MVRDSSMVEIAVALFERGYPEDGQPGRVGRGSRGWMLWQDDQSMLTLFQV